MQLNQSGGSQRISDNTDHKFNLGTAFGKKLPKANRKATKDESEDEEAVGKILGVDVMDVDDEAVDKEQAPLDPQDSPLTGAPTQRRKHH
jgi:hypothetical protein